MPDAGSVAESLAPWLPNTTFPPPETPLRVGVSGGADSLALLALAVAAGCEVTAVHVDHGQRATSSREADAVSRAASELGAEFAAHTAAVDPGPNLEARMRAVRYAYLGPDAATGHTADDQAETVLINLLRGSGVTGLGAMQPGHRRPILALRRSDTEAICATLDWTPIDDPSNADPLFVRNRVRHELIPLLCDIAKRDVVPLLARTAQHMRSASDVLNELALDLDPTDARAVASAPLSVASVALQRWIRTATDGDHPIDAAAIVRIHAVASGEALAAEISGGTRIVRSGQRLRIEPISPDD